MVEFREESQNRRDTRQAGKPWSRAPGSAHRAGHGRFDEDRTSDLVGVTTGSVLCDAPLWELVRKTLKPELPGSPAKDCAPHVQAR